MRAFWEDEPLVQALTRSVGPFAENDFEQGRHRPRRFSDFNSREPMSADVAGESDAHASDVAIVSPQQDLTTAPIVGDLPTRTAASGSRQRHRPQPAPEPDRSPVARGLDRHQQTYAERGPGRVSIDANPTSQLEEDPSLAGINEHVSAMLQRGVPDGEIIAYIQGRGVPRNEFLPGPTGLLNELAWRRANPNYRGGYSVDLNHRSVPISTLRRFGAQAAGGPAGAVAGAFLNDVTGGHLDNIVNVLGGDGELLNHGLSDLERRYPLMSTIGHFGANAGLNVGGKLAFRGVARGLAKFGDIPSIAAAAGRIPLAGIGRAFPIPDVVRGAVPAVAGDLATGAWVSSGSHGTDLFDASSAAKGAGWNAAWGGLSRGLMRGLGRVANPTGGDMAPLYEQRVSPTLFQRAGGGLDDMERSVALRAEGGARPRSARNQVDNEFQRGAVSQPLSQIGRSLPDEVRTGREARTYLDEAVADEFDATRRQLAVGSGSDFDTAVGAIRDNMRALPGASQRAFDNFVAKQIRPRLRQPGGLRGNDYVRVLRRLETRARNVRRNPNGDPGLADAFDRLSYMLDDAASRSEAASALRPRLDSVRQSRRSAEVISEAERRAGNFDGRFAPYDLDVAVRDAGPNASLARYAQAGLELGEPIVPAGYAGPAPASVAIANLANLPGVRNTLNWAIRPGRSISFRERTIPLHSERVRAFLENNADRLGWFDPAPLMQEGRLARIPGELGEIAEALPRTEGRIASFLTLPY